MPAYHYVYVGKEAKKNLGIGVDQGIWGWRPTALDWGGSRAEARRMRVGDHFVLGHRGANSRRTFEEFLGGTFKKVVFAQVVRPLYESSEPVWSDDVYPERVGLDILSIVENVPGVSLGEPAMEALRKSSNKQGAPVSGGAFLVDALTSDDTADPPDDGAAPGATARMPTDPLDLDGPLDSRRLVATRREQRKLRRLKFGDRPTLVCDLCGAELPRRLVAAAHIKRRADASPTERLDPRNIMAACLLGCDALFEHGHLFVDDAGLIRQGVPGGDAIARAADLLAGRPCAAFGPGSSQYFLAHRVAHALAAPATTRLDLSRNWPADYRVESPDHVPDLRNNELRQPNP
ncbi:MAG TPA: hypothetical protein VGD43_00500 [Micromonospora sp.]